VSFDAESVRVGDAPVTDLVLQLKETPSGMLLVSKGSVEPLAQPISVSLSPDHNLVLEPGVRVTRVADGFALSVHNRRRIELEVEGEKTTVVMPVTIEVTKAGWKVAGKERGGNTLTARRLQDDVEQNLGNLGDSAKRILNSNPRTAPKPLVGNTPTTSNPGRMGFVRRISFPPLFKGLYGNSAGFSQETILGLHHASPAGF